MANNDKNLMSGILGLTPWNRSCFEFKFDDTRLSSYYKNKIGNNWNFCLLHSDFAKSLPCWLSQFEKLNWDSQQLTKFYIPRHFFVTVLGSFCDKIIHFIGRWCVVIGQNFQCNLKNRITVFKKLKIGKLNCM